MHRGDISPYSFISVHVARSTVEACCRLRSLYTLNPLILPLVCTVPLLHLSILSLRKPYFLERYAQKNVIGRGTINNKVLDVSKGCPQLYVSPHFYLVSRETIQAAIVRPQLVGRPLQFVEGRLEHHIGG